MGEPISSRFCFDSELVALESNIDHDTILDDDDPLRDWVDESELHLASGSLAPKIASGSQSVRTTTVVDPLTTSVLAEVSRRKPTTEEIPAKTLAAALENTKRR
jgi:hypothetical protein